MSKLIGEGTYLVCDHGSEKTQLKVKNSENIEVNGNGYANETDNIFEYNIPSFKSCRIFGECKNTSFSLWQNPFPTVSSTDGEKKFVKDDSYLVCQKTAQSKQAAESHYSAAWFSDQNDKLTGIVRPYPDENSAANALFMNDYYMTDKDAKQGQRMLVSFGIGLVLSVLFPPAGAAYISAETGAGMALGFVMAGDGENAAKERELRAKGVTDPNVIKAHQNAYETLVLEAITGTMGTAAGYKLGLDKVGKKIFGKIWENGAKLVDRLKPSKTPPAAEVATPDIKGPPPEFSGKSVMEEVIAIIPSEEELNMSLQEWAKMEQALAPSKTRLTDFSTASVVYDSKTGKYYYGMNRGVFLSGEKELNTQLVKMLPEKTLNRIKLGNCAEVDAVNQALNNGALKENLYMYTINTIPYKFGIPKEACANCTFTFHERIGGILSGIYVGE